MKEEKRKELIESAIRLFAEKGFHLTSVQDIVADCQMSKGAFYHYFPSKEALHLAIFKYYFEEIFRWVKRVEQENLNPWERMKKQLYAPFELIKKQKAFFVMYLREQSFSIDRELREFMAEVHRENIVWYENSLIAIYGQQIRPYIGDIILLVDGLRNSYLSAALFLDSQFDAKRIPEFLMNRIDDMVKAFADGEQPILHLQELQKVKDIFSDEPLDPLQRIFELLEEMIVHPELRQLPDEKREGLIGVIGFLRDELRKEDFNEYIVQGMLANLKEVPAFDAYRKEIAGLLDIQLL